MSNYSPSNGAQTFTSFAPSSDLYSLLRWMVPSDFVKTPKFAVFQISTISILNIFLL